MEIISSTPREIYQQGTLFGLYGEVFDLTIAYEEFMEMVEDGVIGQTQPVSMDPEPKYTESEREQIATEFASIERRQKEIARAKREAANPQQKLFPVYKG